MSDDANELETQTDIPVEETPAAQPESQGSDSPSETPDAAAGPAQQAQGEKQSPMIPKWRFDEVNEQLKQERLFRLQQQQPAAATPAPQAPKQEDFSTYEDYIRADARFVAQQEARQAYAAERQREQQARQQQAEQARIYNAEANWTQKSSEVAAKYPDFEQKISTAPRITNDYAVAVLKASPMAGELAYHLASNPETVARLNGMHPLDAAAELGRIEGKLQGAGTPPVKVSQMPKPMTPVGTGKASNAPETGVNRALSLLYPS